MKKDLSFLLLVLFIFSILSCEKETKREPYEGTWSITTSGYGFQMKDVLTLTKSTFIDLGSSLINDVWVTTWGSKGTMVVTDINVVLTFTHAGGAEYNYLTDTYGEFIWYGSGTPQFEDMLQDMGGNVTLNGEFLVAGDTLTTRFDLDNDDLYISANEVTVYTR